MTTGRINQVTIFSRPKEGNEFPSSERNSPGHEIRAERFSIETRPRPLFGPGRVCDGAPPGAKGPGDSSRSRRKAPSLEARLYEFLPGRSSDPEGQALSGEGNECPTPEIAAFPQADPQS